MFRSLCGFFIIMIVSVNSAQTYVPFPTDSAIWAVDRYSEISGPPGYEISHFKYVLDGKTNIGQTMYTNIYSYEKDDAGTEISNHSFYGWIREDSLRKVYYRHSVSDSEVILYDFLTTTVGDSIQVSVDLFEPLYMTKYFKGIGQSLLMNTIYDAYYYDYLCGETYADTILLGIGNIRGPFFTEFCRFTGPYYYLRDFKKGSGSTYYDTVASIDFQEPNKHIKNNLNISPNPFNSTVKIALSQGNSIQYLRIYNVTGACVYKKQVDAPVYSWNASGLPSGSYYVCVNNISGLESKYIAMAVLTR